MIVINGVWNFAISAAECEQALVLSRIQCHTHVTDTERHGQVIAVRESSSRLWKQLHNTPPLPRPVKCCVHTVFAPPIATRVANITVYIVHYTEKL